MSRNSHSLRTTPAERFFTHSSRNSLPSHKSKLERFCKKLEVFLDRHDGLFGKPTRIYGENSTEFVNVNYLVEFFEKTIEERYLDTHGGKNPDAP
jgi:hypothetical protein